MTRDEFSLPDAGFFRRVAAAAAAQTLPRFRQGGAVLNKAKGGFDPVTEADREAETAIRGLIRETFPGHGMLGEEFGRENGDSPFQWVIDPIDGTRAFISGLPLWGTLVGLTVDGRAVAGMMAQPFIGELFYATGVRLQVHRRTTPLRFDSAEHFTTFMETSYGPTLKARERLTAEARWDECRQEIVELMERRNEAPDGLLVPAEYLVVVARKREAQT